MYPCWATLVHCQMVRDSVLNGLRHLETNHLGGTSPVEQPPTRGAARLENLAVRVERFQLPWHRGERIGSHRNRAPSQRLRNVTLIDSIPPFQICRKPRD